MAAIERQGNGGNGEQALRERLLGSPVTLRAVEEPDHPVLLRWFKDSRVMPHLIGVSLDTTEKQMREFYGMPRLHGYVGERNGSVVSTVSFIDPDPNDPDTFARFQSAEMVRVAVDPFRFNNRYGTQTLILAIEEHAFNSEDLNYEKIAAGYVVTPDDPGGHRRIRHVLVDTLGFREIGQRRNEVVREYGERQIRQDVVLVELDRDTWARKREKAIREHFPSSQDRRGLFPTR